MDADFTTYLQARREQYVAERVRLLGQEYEESRSAWDAVFETEWRVMEERLRAGARLGGPLGFGLATQFGEDHLDRELAQLLEEEIRLVSSEFEDLELPALGYSLPYIYYDDFVALSNQGIFRVAEFLLNRQRRWEKKVVEELAVYGYQRIAAYPWHDETLLHFREVSP